MMGILREDPANPDYGFENDVGYPVEGHITVDDDLQVQTLPADTQLATPPLQDLLSAGDADEIYDSLLQWVEDNGYVVAASCCQIFD